MNLLIFWQIVILEGDNLAGKGVGTNQNRGGIRMTLRKRTLHNDYQGRQPHPRYLQYLLLITFFGTIFITTIPVSATENATITCGVILPLSGDSNISGTELLNGIQLAADEINTNGGAAGYRINLRIADDQGDPQKALSYFKEMQAEGIPIVIGSETTVLTLPMAEETKNTKGTLLISPQANGEVLYGISPLFYQVNPPIFSLAQFVSEWLVYTSDRTAVIYIDDEYGRSVLKNIKAGLKNSTIPITDAEPVTHEDTDYAALSEKILNSAPDAIVIIVYDSRQIPIIRNLTGAGFRGQVILTESGEMDTLEKEESDVLAKFPLFTISSNTNLVPGSHSDHFVTSYRERFGQDPAKGTAGYGYDSLMVIADAIRLGSEGGNISAKTIQKGLEASRYYGVTGPKVFDSHHAAGTALDRWGFRNGSFELMTLSLV